MRTILAAIFAWTLSSAPSFAQFYAYAELGNIDAQGHAIIDPATDKQKSDGICLIWRPGWVFDNRDVPIFGTKAYYSIMNYRADPRARTITVYQVEAPGVIATRSGVGYYPMGGTVVFNLNISVPMYPSPRDEWPCSKETWEAVLSLPEKEYQIAPLVPWGTSGGRSGGSAAGRPPLAVCKSPNWPGFHC